LWKIFDQISGEKLRLVYKKGVENLVADVLSCILEQAELHSISTPSWSTLEFIKEEQQHDPELQNIFQRLTHDPSSIPRHLLVVECGPSPLQMAHYFGFSLHSQSYCFAGITCGS
jgi:hypothetical protein